MSTPRKELISELARLFAEHGSDEVLEAMRSLADPDRMAHFGRLVEQAAHAAPRRPRGRSTPKPRDMDDRLAAVKAARPGEAVLIDAVVAGSVSKWTEARRERIESICARSGVEVRAGRTGVQRRARFVELAESAPRHLLEELANEFERVPVSGRRSEGGTLQEWSDIILKDRKPRT